MSGLPEPTALRRRGVRDWRIWLGAAITVLCMWLSLRDVPIDAVVAAMARADLWILTGLSVPAYVLAIGVRALRWRHLTNPVATLPRGLLTRAVAIGFMVNNLVPLRIGEVVRAWFVGRESGASVSAIFGTVVLERVIDVVSVLVLAFFGLGLAGIGSAESAFLRRGAILMLPVALAPLAGLVLLRIAPEPVIAAARFVLRPLPDRLSSRVDELLRKFASGLGALSGGSHLFWIAFHSAVIWLVLSMVPVLAGFLAFHLELGSLANMMVLSWIVLGAVGVAVAIPSAPGFFGTYQLAFQMVLVRFGVDSATALALGLVVWVVFWVTLTGLGLIVIRLGGQSLGELSRAAR